jgi:hypothetical protein
MLNGVGHNFLRLAPPPLCRDGGVLVDFLAFLPVYSLKTDALLRWARGVKPSRGKRPPLRFTACGGRRLSKRRR